jgi:hypothetical protein
MHDNMTRSKSQRGYPVSSKIELLSPEIEISVSQSRPGFDIWSVPIRYVADEVAQAPIF